MLIVTAANVTENLQREDGIADYRVQVNINYTPIWKGEVNGHVRDEGAAALLRRIADTMDADK